MLTERRAANSHSGKSASSRIVVFGYHDIGAGCLRELVRLTLETLGYRAAVTANGAAALLLVEEHGLKPELLLTDVVMPGMSGRELAIQLEQSYPGLRVLYISGYTGDAIVHHGMLDPGIHFIQKPFSLCALAAKLKSALGKE